MIPRRPPAALAVLGCAALLAAARPAQAPPQTYHAPTAVADALKGHAAKSPRIASLVDLGRSAGGRPLLALRLSAAGPGGDPETRPAVLVTANLDGIHPVGTEAALRLLDKLVAGYPADKAIAGLLEKHTVWVAPLLNPDAAARLFGTPREARPANARPLDQDVDGRLDEDGPDDLNGDGLITRMRVRDPEGRWIADPKEPRLLRLADARKGERGVYAVYDEGFDNDGDGAYNEDPPGGVEPGRNFPHDFPYTDKAAGPWPVSEPETIALLRFMSDHPAIALVLDFSTANTILNQQQTGQARAGGDKVKVPAQYAQAFGLDPEAEYTLKQVADALNALNIAGGMEIDESMVAMFLGLGPAVAVDRQDVPLCEAIQKDYQDALKAAKIEGRDKRARGVAKGGFPAYAYFQFGVPVVSTEVWSVPEPKKAEPQDALTAEKLKAMSSEDFLALGEEKIGAFLKARGAPANFNAAMVMKMVKAGQVTPPKMAEMMAKMPPRPDDGEDHPDAFLLQWSDLALKGAGFVAWTPYRHPTLGEVEIGGFAPGFAAFPPAADLEPSLALHADFYLGLMSRLPRLEIVKTEVERLGPDTYRVAVCVANTGWFPTATGQGRRAGTAWPVRVAAKTAAGQSLFAGRPVENVPSLDGSGGTRKLEWTVRGPKGSRFEVTARAPRAGAATAAVTLQ